MSLAERKRAESWIFVSSFLQTCCTGIMMQAMDQIFLAHFQGDFARHGRTISLVSSLSSCIGFLVTPILGSLIDTRGRKPLLVLSTAVNASLKLLTAVAPQRLLVPSIVLSWGCSAVTFDGFSSESNRPLQAAFLLSRRLFHRLAKSGRW